MYNPAHFKEPDARAIRDFMHQHPFITLCGVDENGSPVATQVPVFIEEREGKTFLVGHLAKASDHTRALLARPQDVLAIFTSPHCYVSATWYKTPNIGSTWNYMSVHARGPIRFGDREELIRVMRKLTLHYEKGDTQSTTVYDNLPQEYLDSMLKAILPFEVEVTRLDHVFKLSQNRDRDSFQLIIDKLSAGDESARFIAAEMEKRKSLLYPPDNL